MTARRLYLIWQSPKTRAQYRIGELSFDGSRYGFRYDEDGLKRARVAGFELKHSPIYPSFPDIQRTYESRELPATIAHRLPARGRPDYAAVLSDKGLSPSASPFEVLRATRGRLATDPLFFEEAPQKTDQGTAIIRCFIAGWKYYRGEEILTQLRKGDPVRLIPERANRFDPSAVAVVSQRGEKLGYLPAFHSNVIAGAFPEGRRVEARMVDIDPAATPGERVRIEITVEMAGRQGLSDEEVKTRLIDKLRTNRLPRQFPNAVQGADLEGNEPILISSGKGQTCSVCDEVAGDPQEIVTEFRYPDGQRFMFHNRCFDLWNDLRHVPIRRLEA